VYDASHRLVYAIDAEGEVTETRYDGASRVIEVIG
jgi:YD repeat-containing protein